MNFHEKSFWFFDMLQVKKIVNPLFKLKRSCHSCAGQTPLGQGKLFTSPLLDIWERFNCCFLEVIVPQLEKVNTRGHVFCVVVDRS